MSEEEILNANGPDLPGAENGDALEQYTRLINNLNEAFHHSYRQAIRKSHDALGQKKTPVIIVSGDQVTLFHDGVQETELIISHLYQQVKSISHLSFGVYVTLSNNGLGPLDEDLRTDLAYQLELLETGLAVLPQLAIPPQVITLQRDTLTMAAQVVGDVLQSGRVEEEQLRAFGDVSAPLYLENAALAARLELDDLHHVIRRWQEQIGPQDWRNVYVVICAAHQARYRETTKQYFQKLLHEQELPGTNYENRVIYAEHIYDTADALALLARHLLDQKISIALFGDRTRLQEDLMSDGAADYLQMLLA